MNRFAAAHCTYIHTYIHTCPADKLRLTLTSSRATTGACRHTFIKLKTKLSYQTTNSFLRQPRAAINHATRGWRTRHVKKIHAAETATPFRLMRAFGATTSLWEVALTFLFNFTLHTNFEKKLIGGMGEQLLTEVGRFLTFKFFFPFLLHTLRGKNWWPFLHDLFYYLIINL